MLKIAYSNCYSHPLPEGHKFPMVKYDLLRQQLMYLDIAKAGQFFEPKQCALDILTLTHTNLYLNDLMHLTLTDSQIRKIGFPLTRELVTREFCLTQGTIDCALFALKHGASLNIAGGTHHAFSNRGEGFCLLNDLAVAANYLLQYGHVRKVLIVDLDVHQGNGTAEIFEQHDAVFTFSMHGKNNYPFIKQHSNLDVELPDGIDGNSYLQTLTESLAIIEARFKPDIVLYQSGVDVLETDKFGKLKLTIADCRLRDEIIFNWCKLHQIPMAAAMGGGYSPTIGNIVDAHTNTFLAAAKIFEL